MRSLHPSFAVLATLLCTTSEANAEDPADRGAPPAMAVLSTDAPVPVPVVRDASADEATPASEPGAASATQAAPEAGGATGAESARGERREREPENRLVPRRQNVLMRDHEVALGKMKFQPGKGLVVASENGRFKLATRLRAQFLYTLQHDGVENDIEHGLQIRRARLQFGGHVFNEHNRFKAELAFSPRDEGFDGTPHHTPLLDWYAELDYLRDLTLRIGQYKVPYSRQRVISSGNLQLVDRSMANGEFNLDRDIGLDLRSKDLFGLGRLRYYAGVYLGEGRDQYDLSSFDLMYLGRVEVLPFGSFKDYSEADFERSRRPRLSLGAAYGFVDDAVRNRGIKGKTPTDGGTTDYHNATADFMFKIVGLSLSGEFFYRHGRRDFGDATVVDEMGGEMPAPREDPRNGIGWFLQGGFLVPRLPLEIAGRYGQVRALGVRTSLPNLDEAGGGLSYYFAHHPLKLQLDYFHTWEDAVLPRGSDRVRLQLQTAF